MNATPARIFESKVGTASWPQNLVIYNTSTTATVYVGGDDVDINNGMPILPSQHMTIPMVGGTHVWGLCATSVELRLLATLQENLWTQ